MQKHDGSMSSQTDITKKDKRRLKHKKITEQKTNCGFKVIENGCYYPRGAYFFTSLKKMETILNNFEETQIRIL